MHLDIDKLRSNCYFLHVGKINGRASWFNMPLLGCITKENLGEFIWTHLS